MPDMNKSGYWQALRALGWEPTQPYVNWKTEELAGIYTKMLSGSSEVQLPEVEQPSEQQILDWGDAFAELKAQPPQIVANQVQNTHPKVERIQVETTDILEEFGMNTPALHAEEPEEKTFFEQVAEVRALADEANQQEPDLSVVEEAVIHMPPLQVHSIPDGQEALKEWSRQHGIPLTDVADSIAGLRTNTHGYDDPLRIDTRGRIWFQDEVRKPASAKPRARRKMKYIDTGVKTIETVNRYGEIEESFEVAGEESRELDVTITLASWQVGIYKAPDMPFRIHTYNGKEGFSRIDVWRHYGGERHVPSTCKRIYIMSDRCYDITSVRETMMEEFRLAQLTEGRNH